MKSKTHNTYHTLNAISKGEWYKSIYILTLMLAFYGGIILSANTESFTEATLVAFQFPFFNLLVFALFFLNTLYICVTFNQDFSFYIIRLGNKRKYILNLLKLIIIASIFHLLIFLMLYSMFLNLSHFGNFAIKNYFHYSVTNLVYLIFYLSRYFLILLLINALSALTFIIFNKNLTLVANSFFLAGFIPKSNYIDITNELLRSLHLWSYFDGNSLQKTFLLETFYSTFFLFILFILVYLLYKYSIKSKKWSIT